MNKFFNIGELDRRFLIEKQSIAVEPVMNSQVINWVTHAKCWGKFRNLPGKEVIETQQQVSPNTVEIQTRFVANVDETMRITDLIYGGIYYLNNVDANKREDYLIIKATKRDNQ
jgi:SPP1 family predicted phage head-tail adaptor